MPVTPRASEIKTQAGRRLRAARLMLGFERQEGFANLIGVGVSTLSMWENGERLCDPLAMTRLWQKTKIGPDWIYAGSLAGVPYDRAQELAAKAAEIGAVMDGPVAEFPREAEHAARRPAAAPKRPAGRVLHDRPQKTPDDNGHFT